MEKLLPLISSRSCLSFNKLSKRHSLLLSFLCGLSLLTLRYIVGVAFSYLTISPILDFFLVISINSINFLHYL